MLSNWYSGSESVSHVLSHLLGEGFFYNYPWTPAIGHAFRGDDVPKLIVVYTNEFDNQVVRVNWKKSSLNWDSSTPRGVSAIPEINAGRVVFTPAFHSSYSTEAPDTWCLQNLRDPSYTRFDNQKPPV